MEWRLRTCSVKLASTTSVWVGSNGTPAKGGTATALFWAALPQVVSSSLLPLVLVRRRRGERVECVSATLACVPRRAELREGP